MTTSDLTISSSAHGDMHIDLSAIASNYAVLCGELEGSTTCGSCVKADAYGLGQTPVSRTLALAGCQDFFVAYAEGGIALRRILPDVRIHVFSGLAGGSVDDFSRNDLTPVLNCLDDIKAWSSHCRDNDFTPPADIHIDTGMCRLGMPFEELAFLEENSAFLDDLNIDLVMSHLACADTPEHPMNREQLELFTNVRRVLPMGRASLANSSGVFLGKEYHFDLVRPGAALYGINPVPHRESPVSQVIRLQGKILQVRSVDTPQTVGYGASHQVAGPGRIATVGAGYADGYLRFLSGCSTARIGNISVPVVGQVSMDMITLDITDVPEAISKPGMFVDLIGPHHDVDAVASDSGTIGYEILAALGSRYNRIYHNGGLHT